MELSTAAARAVCTSYAGWLRHLLAKPLPDTTKQLGEAIGRLWLDAYTELEKLDGDRRHGPRHDRPCGTGLMVPGDQGNPQPARDDQP